MTPTLVDFKDIQVGDIIFANIPYGVDFTFPVPFNQLDPGMGWMRCTQLPVEIPSFPIGTMFAIARGVGVVR